MRTIKRLALSHCVALAAAVPLVAFCGWSADEFRDLPLWLFVGLSINELESKS